MGNLELRIIEVAILVLGWVVWRLWRDERRLFLGLVVLQRQVASAAPLLDLHTDTQRIYLCRSDGTREAEVSWHRSKLPPTLGHAGYLYKQNRKVADGEWEYYR